jgi:hypothetical protein
MTRHLVDGYASGMKAMPNSYHIQVQDHVDATLAEWFAPLQVTNQPNGEATLTGLVRDQAELYGILRKLANLNFTLIAVQCMPDSPAAEGDTLALEDCESP